MSRIVFDSKDRRFIVIFFIKRKKKEKKKGKWSSINSFPLISFIRVSFYVLNFSRKGKKKKTVEKVSSFPPFRTMIEDNSVRWIHPRANRKISLIRPSRIVIAMKKTRQTISLFVSKIKKIIAHISVVINAFYSASLLQLHLQRENPCLFVEGPVSYLLSRRADDEVKLEDAAN